MLVSSILALAVASLASAQLACDPTNPLTPPFICDIRSASAIIVPSVIPTFLPVGLLNVQYGNLQIAAAMQLAKERVAYPPTVSYNQTVGVAPTGPHYILLAVDPDAPLKTAPTAPVLHWLVTNVALDAATLALGGGTEVASYLPPSPPVGDQPHRFVILLYNQPANFSVPAALQNLPATATGARVGFNLAAFVAQNGLGNPISGTFFSSAWNTPGAPAVVTGTTADPLTLPVPYGATIQTGGPLAPAAAQPRHARRRMRTVKRA